MKILEIISEAMGPNMDDSDSVEEWIIRYKRIAKGSDSSAERAMATRLLDKLQSDILHDKLYKDASKPESMFSRFGRGLGRGISKFANAMNEETLMELGPDLKDKRSVEEWITRYKRIIEESDSVGEREMASRLLDKLYADLGRSPDPKPKAKATGRSVSTGAFKVVFFGHFEDPMAGKRGSDKVWGWGVKDDFIFQFWGPNGKTPGVKRLPNTPENREKLQKLQFAKERKGYDKINASDHVSWLKRVLEAKLRFDG